ncbi:MAG: hypothetical protein J6U40_10355 [Kiritimatiellae bacterium]|nr:hypothetical protein [Kiritimatiellia bacterium]
MGPRVIAHAERSVRDDDLLIGLGAALVCRCVLGLPTAKMLLPTIPLMLLLLLIFRKRLLAFGTVPDGEVRP